MIIGFIFAAQREDFWLDWSREVPSKLSTAELGTALSDLKLWPVYHHSLKSATLLNTLTLQTGSELRLNIEPLGKEWKRFELLTDPAEINPGKKMKFHLKGDSKKKISTIFDDFEWEVAVEEASPELKAKGFQSIVVGKARAHTNHWRGRLFGTISPRILMNQVYYVDLVKLASYTSQIETSKLNQSPTFQ